MACHLCGDQVDYVAVKVLELVNGVYSDSHDGVALCKCRDCGRLFVRYWVEVFDDIHRYYVPVSESEADYFRGDPASSLPENDVQKAAKNLISSRRHLQQSPGSKTAFWMDNAPPLPGFSW